MRPPRLLVLALAVAAAGVLAAVIFLGWAIYSTATSHYEATPQTVRTPHR